MYFLYELVSLAFLRRRTTQDLEGKRLRSEYNCTLGKFGGKTHADLDKTKNRANASSERRYERR